MEREQLGLLLFIIFFKSHSTDDDDEEDGKEKAKRTKRRQGLDEYIFMIFRGRVAVHLNEISVGSLTAVDIGKIVLN